MEVPFLHLGFRNPNYSSGDLEDGTLKRGQQVASAVDQRTGSRPKSEGSALRRRGPSPHRGVPANLQDGGQAS